jgi:hypothetical protein
MLRHQLRRGLPGAEGLPFGRPPQPVHSTQQEGCIYPHRLDESPAEYSLASCSPAELAPASPATTRLSQSAILNLEFCMVRRVLNSPFVSKKGSVHGCRFISFHRFWLGG